MMVPVQGEVPEVSPKNFLSVGARDLESKVHLGFALPWQRLRKMLGRGDLFFNQG